MPFEKIRRTVGDKMDIMVEFHSLWSLPMACKLAAIMAQFDTYWHEDPIKMDSLGELVRYAAVSHAPICASETLASRWAFRFPDCCSAWRGKPGSRRLMAEPR